MEEIEILLTDSANSDLQKLSSELESGVLRSNEDSATFDYKLNKIDDLSNVLLALHKNVPVACCGFKQYNSDSIAIELMYVTPSYRRRKIASQLLSELEELAKSMLFKYCLIETERNQPEATSFYSRYGYSQIETLDRLTSGGKGVCFRKAL